MPNTFQSWARPVLLGAVALVPWVLSMYVLYWLEVTNNWTSETAHRGKASVAILMLGMGLSFLVQSRIAKRKRQ